MIISVYSRFLFRVFRGCKIGVYPCSSVVHLFFSRSLALIGGFYSVCSVYSVV